MTSPRPYVAAAAASVLAALYFVPSATAGPVATAASVRSTARPVTAPAAPAAPASGTAAGSQDRLGGLADTGAVDTKPYIVGGAAFLAAGAGLVLNAGRRSRSAVA